MASCSLCGQIPHSRSCAWRLPGWLVPLPREKPYGGPVESSPAEVQARTRRRPAERQELAVRAAGLRSQGMTWPQVGAALGVAESTACTLAKQAAPPGG